jgi:prepilin signal peptidase PulO-like enzyme (type II secretory pathway)
MVKNCLLIAISTVISLFDLKERRAPDLLTLGGLAVMLLLSGIEGADALVMAITGAAVGTAVLFAARLITKGGLGLGDVKFAALLGSGLGLRLLFIALFLSALFALGFAGFSYIRGRFTRGTELPFAPFLGGGSVLALLLSVFIPGLAL